MAENITLAFDTCLNKMFLALTKDGELLTSKVVENHYEKYHSAFLISSIKEILKENDLTPKDIGLIATNIGPGSFTGIRACTTVARVMAQQLGCRAIGVSSLEILSKLADNNVAVALDARKNKAYLYLDKEIKGAVDLEEVKELVKEKKLITDDTLLPILGGESYQSFEVNLGEILAKIVNKKSKTEDCDWKKLKPLYIQPPPMGCRS